MIEADHRFCVSCWQSLTFLSPPWCAGCNVPMPAAGDETMCGPCLAEAPRHSGVCAVVAYGPIARAMALRLKYGGRGAFAETVARLMLRNLPDGADLVMPVPLHRSRLWARGYNQAALIAQAIGRGCEREVDVTSLTRKRATRPLRGMGPAERRRVVKGAFVLAPGARTTIAGRNVALVDDVYTTGATAAACTDVLLRGGAASVTIVCWARVLTEETAD